MTLDLDRLADRAGLWPSRAVWLATPLVAGPGLGSVLDGRPATPSLVVEIGLWAAWFAVLVATLVPSPRSLTLCRIAAPVGPSLSLIAMAVAGTGAGAETAAEAGAGSLGGGELGAPLAAGMWTLLFLAVVSQPLFADRMINGSAYGSERRMALRPPGYVLLGPVQMAWLAVFAGLVGPAALVLTERWVLAVMAGAVGAGAIWAGSRILHQLARRWVVFVPAGFVIHDPMTLVDAVLFRRNTITALGPALAGAGGDDDRRTDISGGARGLALEASVREPVPVALRVGNRAENVEVSDVVFAPTLPGAMLAEARIRGVRIGTAP
jgi:hypothetical protein